MSQLALLEEPETERQRCFRVALQHAEAVAHLRGTKKRRAVRAALAWVKKGARS